MDHKIPAGRSDSLFMVNVRSCKNATWQGTVKLVAENRELPFRSALELIKIMDSALEGDTETEPPEPEEDG